MKIEIRHVIDPFFFVLIFCAGYGAIIYPLVLQEFGGGEPKEVIAKFIDPQHAKLNGYISTAVSGAIVYASDKSIFIKTKDGIRFVPRDSILSVMEVRPDGPSRWQKLWGK